MYSRNPGEFGKENVLICHASGFHPPDITIQLMKGEEELKNSNQTDLAFKEDWHFHLTKSVYFTPQSAEVYTCKVTHGGKVKMYNWGELRKGRMFGQTLKYCIFLDMGTFVMVYLTILLLFYRNKHVNHNFSFPTQWITSFLRFEFAFKFEWFL